jgi:hypothetical protein
LEAGEGLPVTILQTTTASNPQGVAPLTELGGSIWAPVEAHIESSRMSLNNFSRMTARTTESARWPLLGKISMGARREVVLALMERHKSRRGGSLTLMLDPAT